MQITLLPPLLPTEGVTSVPTSSPAFTPGMKIVATVLATAAHGGTLLSLFGRPIPAGGALPYPAGTTLRLEVVEGGARPLLRLLGAEQAVHPSGDPSARPSGSLPGLPVSAVTYGLAAAVLAARQAPDVRAAAAEVLRWMPALVASGLVRPVEGEALARALSPVSVPAGPSSPSTDGPAPDTVARALAARVADGGLLLERRLADLVRHSSPGAEQAAGRDVRSRLAGLADALGEAPPTLVPARTAVEALQAALLAEQARTAAHLARDGVVDIRIPVHVAGQDGEMRLRLRIEKDAPEGDGAHDAAPWRHVTLHLALEGLGRVQVRLGIAASQVQAEFVVERADAADAIEEGLADLGGALEAAGFARVLSRVLVDPVRVCAPDDLPDLPPQHTILDARA